MKASKIKDGKRVAVTHGELFILPVDSVPEGKTSKHETLVLAHSETGHHHVLESPKHEFLHYRQSEVLNHEASSWFG